MLNARTTGQVVAYLVKFGPEYTQALAVAQNLIDQLRDRGLTLKVDTARADNGMALLIEDTTPIAA